MEWREPLIVNSNWYVLGKNDENHPQHLLSNQGIQPSGYFSKFQVKRAAHLIRRILEYKEKIDRYVDRKSYNLIFNTFIEKRSLSIQQRIKNLYACINIVASFQ